VRDYPITDEIAAQYVWFDIGGDDASAVERYNKIKGASYDFLVCCRICQCSTFAIQSGFIAMS
jgi:hypothetical protein